MARHAFDQSKADGAKLTTPTRPWGKRGYAHLMVITPRRSFAILRFGQINCSLLNLFTPLTTHAAQKVSPILSLYSIIRPMLPFGEQLNHRIASNSGRAHVRASRQLSYGRHSGPVSGPGRQFRVCLNPIRYFCPFVLYAWICISVLNNSMMCFKPVHLLFFSHDTKIRLWHKYCLPLADIRFEFLYVI